MSETTVTLSRLTAFIQEALTKVGLPEQDASTVAAEAGCAARSQVLI